MADTPTQQASKLITLYVGLYENRYGKKPTINRYKLGWGVKEMITDLGHDGAKEVIEYYLSFPRGSGHPLEWLLYNYETVQKKKRELDEDEAKRREIRLATAKRVEEWQAQIEH